MAEQQKPTDNKNPMLEGLTLVLMRNAFYRDNYRRAVLSLIIVFFIDIVLGASIAYRYLNPPEPQYFATTASSQLIKFHPLTDPVVDDNYVLQWTANAVQQAFSLDFIHWRQQLMQAANNFTPSGWHFFLSAFKQSGDLDTLVHLQMVSNAVVTGAPVILYQNVLGDRYVWKIELPILITYISTAKTIHQPLKITVMVDRVPVQDNPNQIAINEFLPEVQGQ